MSDPRTDPEPEPDFQDTIELVHLAKTGDRAALEEVLERYYPRVLSLVRSRLGPRLRRHLESDDLVQETMGEVVRSLDAFEMRDERAFIRWLSFLVENRIRDSAKFFRAKKRAGAGVRTLELRGYDSEDPAGRLEPQDVNLTPPENAEQLEMSELVRSGLRRLPDHQREVIERRAAQDKWAEIAEAMGLPSAGAARQLHARAKLALMRVLAKELPEEGLDAG